MVEADLTLLYDGLEQRGFTRHPYWQEWWRRGLLVRSIVMMSGPEIFVERTQLPHQQPTVLYHKQISRWIEQTPAQVIQEVLDLIDADG